MLVSFIFLYFFVSSFDFVEVLFRIIIYPPLRALFTKPLHPRPSRRLQQNESPKNRFAGCVDLPSGTSMSLRNTVFPPNEPLFIGRAVETRLLTEVRNLSIRHGEAKVRDKQNDYHRGKGRMPANPRLGQSVLCVSTLGKYLTRPKPGIGRDGRVMIMKATMRDFSETNSGCFNLPRW